MKPLELAVAIWLGGAAAIITAAVFLLIVWLILGFWLISDLFT